MVLGRWESDPGKDRVQMEETGRRPKRVEVGRTGVVTRSEVEDECSKGESMGSFSSKKESTDTSVDCDDVGPWSSGLQVSVWSLKCGVETVQDRPSTPGKSFDETRSQRGIHWTPSNTAGGVSRRNSNSPTPLEMSTRVSLLRRSAVRVQVQVTRGTFRGRVGNLGLCGRDWVGDSLTGTRHQIPEGAVRGRRGGGTGLFRFVT